MAGLRTEERQIGSTRYRVVQLGLSKARPILWLGASTLVPGLESLGGIKIVDEHGRVNLRALLEADLGTIGKAARIFFDRATVADFERVEEAFASTTLVNVGGDKWVKLADVRELHWPSVGYGEFFGWFAFAVEVNFGPFSFGSGAVSHEPPKE